VAKVAGLLFGFALLAGLAAPVLAAVGVTDIVRPEGVWGVALSGVGLGLTAAGFVLAALAQQAMGRSWRIGVDPSENTELVTGGLFAWARNPIFTGMIAAQAGTVLLAPTGLGSVGAALLLIACELQVRKVEEPYLVRTHGRSYVGYARLIGRFLPRVGRLHDRSIPVTEAAGGVR